MKMNITPLKTAAVAAVIGLSPALMAQSSINSQQSNQQNKNRATTSSTQDQQAGSSSTYGQQQSQAQQQSQQRQQSQQASSQIRPASQDPRGMEASDLIGWEVSTQNGDKLGDLKDLIVDTSSGKLLYGVVASGGVLGVGETLRVVPVKALKQDNVNGDDRLTLNIDKAKWDQGPVFAEDQLASLSQDQRRQQIFQHYGQTHDAQSAQRATQPSQKQGQSQSQQGAQKLAMVSDLMGKDIESGSQTVGTVEDVIVQLKNRTAAALIDPNDEFAGTDQKYIIPFNKLTIAGEDKLTTTVTRQDFASARPSRDDSWGNESVGYVSTLYVWPMYTAGSNRQASANTSAQSNDPFDSSRSSESMAQSGSQQKSSPVEAIRQAIKSESAQGSVNVTSSGEKVVLTGVVASEDAKDRIEESAERAAQGWDIDNQIRVAQQQDE